MDARGGEPNLRWFSLSIYFVRVPCGAVKNPIALVHIRWIRACCTIRLSDAVKLALIRAQ